jgi:hypothetical protein
MLTTIMLGTCVTIQGALVKRHDNGLLTVRVGARTFTGRPINTATAAA